MIIWTFFQTSKNISIYKYYLPNALRPRSFSYLDLRCVLSKWKWRSPEWESWEPPRPTDGPHAECDIQAWAVAEEAGEDSFEQEAEIQRLVRHSLLENRILTRLGNDQIGPLQKGRKEKR